MNWSIDDFGLTATQLEEKYEKRGAHPEYRWEDFHLAWPGKSADDEAYWSWVVEKLQAEKEELDSNNPYN